MGTMSRRAFLAQVGCGAAFCANARARDERPPNFVVIFLDDSGWADFEPFGESDYKTPNVDRLAREGCIFRNFYVPQAICSASRAALLSGCFPGRTKVFSALPPKARGLDPRYATMGEVFQRAGYRTAIFGKWHIGDQPDTRPPARGFDESCGLMYSNDMWSFHPDNPEYWGKFPLQFWENGEVVIDEVTHEHQTHLTTWYTEHAVDFIHRHRDTPFLLYVPHSMPHVPLHCSEKFEGKSGAGLYGDVMMEIDWSVGEVTRALRDSGLEDNTVVFFSSDNGPWATYGNHAGRTPFRAFKGTSFEGGVRSACIMRYPGHIRRRSSSTRAFCTVDLLPTFAALANAPLPDYPIDGENVWDLICGKPGAVNPHAYYPMSIQNRFEGLVSGDGRWKLHLPHPYLDLAETGADGKPGRYEVRRIGTALYDLENDPLERNNVAAKYPDVTARLGALAEEHRKQFYPDQPGG